jgi:TatD DNase family protein
MTPFIDFHTHQKVFGSEVFAIQNVMVEKDDFLSKKYFSIGIHPMFINLQSIENQYFTIEKTLNQKNCLSLGEIGLDKRSEVSIDEQIKIFSQQIKIAEQKEKPIVIHCVKAFSELISVKKNLKPKVPLVVHGFNNNENIFNSLLENGFYFSFGKAILEKSNASRLILKTPIEKLFLETDDTEIPIEKIYSTAAQLLAVEQDFLRNQILQNCQNINIFF